MPADKIKAAILKKDFRITKHAEEEQFNDNLFYEDIIFSTLNGQIIKSYENDYPLPSYLILGFSKFNKSPIHSIWAYDNSKSNAILITVYRPDPGKWVEFKLRKKNHE